jgi:hypothetical protein
MATRDSSTNVVRWLVIGGALLVADKVLGFFAPDNPGGDVTPGTGDDRPATFTPSDAGVLADRIFNDVWGGGLVATPWEKDEDFAATLMVPKVTNDVRMLMNAYGSRGDLFSPQTLAETVADYLDADLRQAVADDYAAKGITIRF